VLIAKGNPMLVDALHEEDIFLSRVRCAVNHDMWVTRRSRNGSGATE
jgi:hypothetical protein